MSWKNCYYSITLLATLCSSALQGNSSSSECSDHYCEGPVKFLIISNKVVTGDSPFLCTPSVIDPSSFPWPNTQVEPSLAVGRNPIDRDRPMVVIGYQEDRYNTNGGANDDYMIISLDGGKTFGTPIPAPVVQCFNGPYERASDPSVAITNQGEIYFSAITIDSLIDSARSNVAVAKYNVCKKEFLYIHYFDPQDLFSPAIGGTDFDGIVIDPQDKSGNTAYETWTTYFLNPDFSDKSSIIRLSKTTDGVHWSKPIDVYQFPQSVVDQFAGDAGAFVGGVTLLNNPGKPFSKLLGLFSLGINGNQPLNLFTQISYPYSNVSTDQGETWTNPIPINDTNNIVFGQVVNPDNFQTLVRGVGGGTAVDRERNIIYFLNQEHSLAYDGIPAEIILYVSIDDAASWNQVGPINSDLSTQAFLPSICVLDEGRIAISYYDLRNAKSNPSEPLTTDRWLDIFSFDKEKLKLTLEQELRLTEQSFNYINAPILGQSVVNVSPPGVFLGDYFGMQFFERKIYHVFGIVPDNGLQSQAHLQLCIIKQERPIPGSQ